MDESTFKILIATNLELLKDEEIDSLIQRLSNLSKIKRNLFAKILVQTDFTLGKDRIVNFAQLEKILDAMDGRESNDYIAIKAMVETHCANIVIVPDAEDVEKFAQAIPENLTGVMAVFSPLFEEIVGEKMELGNLHLAIEIVLKKLNSLPLPMQFPFGSVKNELSHSLNVTENVDRKQMQALFRLLEIARDLPGLGENLKKMLGSIKERQMEIVKTLLQSLRFDNDTMEKLLHFLKELDLESGPLVPSYGEGEMSISEKLVTTTVFVTSFAKSYVLIYNNSHWQEEAKQLLQYISSQQSDSISVQIRELMEVYGNLNLGKNLLCGPLEILTFTNNCFTDDHKNVLKKIVGIQQSRNYLTHARQKMLLQFLLSPGVTSLPDSQKLGVRIIAFATDEKYGENFPLEDLCAIGKNLSIEQLEFFDSYLETVENSYAMNSIDSRKLGKFISILTSGARRNGSMIPLYYLHKILRGPAAMQEKLILIMGNITEQALVPGVPLTHETFRPS